MSEHRSLRVFICHAKEDEATAEKLYNKLKSRDWVRPWLAKHNLIPGMDWDLEICQAIGRADSIIVCFSNITVQKQGFVQKEFKLVLNEAKKIPEGLIFIIPVRLDECNIPPSFNKWHWVDFFHGDSDKNLLVSLRMRAEATRNYCSRYKN